jgi:hypothetical protein
MYCGLYAAPRPLFSLLQIIHSTQRPFLLGPMRAERADKLPVEMGSLQYWRKTILDLARESSNYLVSQNAQRAFHRDVYTQPVCTR